MAAAVFSPAQLYLKELAAARLVEGPYISATLPPFSSSLAGPQCLPTVISPDSGSQRLQQRSRRCLATRKTHGAHFNKRGIAYRGHGTANAFVCASMSKADPIQIPSDHSPHLKISVTGAALSTALRHPNLWGDDLIDSLAGSNKISPTDTNIQMMVRDVKEAFKLMNCSGKGSQEMVREHLLVIDLLDRLGIQRYFQEEIEEALDKIYRFSWTDKGITWNKVGLSSDFGETAMAFKLFRTHGYNVSSDVFKNFTKEGTSISSTSGDATQNLMNMYNLYRASNICFPNESLLGEAHEYSRNQLVCALTGFENSELHGKAAFALKHPWQRCPPRLEARFMIESHERFLQETNSSFERKSLVNTQTLLKLAKADFNFCQALHQKELQDITRWWRDSGFAELSFVRQRPAEIYFSIASFTFEPEFSAVRMAYTKSVCLVIVLDDLFDFHGSLDDLLQFVDTVRRWDPSLATSLSQDFKTCFYGMYNTINSLTDEAARRQGRDISTDIKKEWVQLLDSFIVEREWAGRGLVPSLEMYLANGKISQGLGPGVLIGLFFAGDTLSDEMLEEIDFRSDFMHLASLSGRLINDTKSFQAERDRGELASSVGCLMNENPGTNEEEAVAQVVKMVDNIQKKLNWIFLKPSKVPKICKQVLFNVVRATLFFYAENDGLSVSDREMKKHIKETLFDRLV